MSIPWTLFYSLGGFVECILNAGHWARARITEGTELDAVSPAWDVQLQQRAWGRGAWHSESERVNN